MGIVLNTCDICGRVFRDTAPYVDCTKSPKYVHHLKSTHPNPGLPGGSKRKKKKR